MTDQEKYIAREWGTEALPEECQNEVSEGCYAKDRCKLCATMTPIFKLKLNEQSGMLEEQPRMSKPEKPNPYNYEIAGGRMTPSSEDAYNSDVYHYEINELAAYNEHIASLRKLTILPEHKEHFKAGVGYAEGKDLSISRCKCKIGDDCPVKEGKWLSGCLVAIPTTEQKQEHLGEAIDRASKLIQQLRDYKELAETRRLRIEELEKQSIEDKEAFQGISNTVAGWVEKYGNVLKETEHLREENERLKAEVKNARSNLIWEMIEEWQDSKDKDAGGDAPRFSYNDIEHDLYEWMDKEPKPSPDARRVAIEFAEWVSNTGWNWLKYNQWTNGETVKTTQDLFNLFHLSKEIKKIK